MISTVALFDLDGALQEQVTMRKSYAKVTRKEE
jgi:hypothetical protein